MRFYVGVTDGDWFRFLRSRSDTDEVNFWQPGGKGRFAAIKPGELFLFKLHVPENFIVGGGIFAHSSVLPCSLAWEAFGEKNGAATFQEMRRLIERRRKLPSNPFEEYSIGCIILQQPFFLREADWIPCPSSFALNIVQGKGYDLATQEGREIWDAVAARRTASIADNVARPEAPMFSEPVLTTRRLGQGAFRILITDAYERRCAVTNEKVIHVLEAAHIRPVAEGGTHRLDNGLLLRSDIHTLFDKGYATVTPAGKFRVSRRIKEEFNNGKHYYGLDGTDVWMPSGSDAKPGREFLEWHGDTVFNG